MNPAQLVLEDGTVFTGYTYGADGTVGGPVVVTTAMSGYPELFGSPAVYQQIVVMTWPHVGNVGMPKAEKKVWPSGVVIRDPARTSSSWQPHSQLADVFAANNVVGICGVDTRSLQHHLRTTGPQHGVIAPAGANPEHLLSAIQAELNTQPWAQVSTAEPYRRANDGPTVVVLDLGVNAATVDRLEQSGYAVVVMPHHTEIEELVSQDPVAVILSTGPGDPGQAGGLVALTQQLLTRGVPVWGSGLGFQILGQAVGLSTYELPQGHYGANHPVIHLPSNTIAITAHHHRFALAEPATDWASPAGEVSITHRNLNDDTIEGLQLETQGVLLAAGTQFDPIPAAGPHDGAAAFFDFLTQAAASTSHQGEDL